MKNYYPNPTLRTIRSAKLIYDAKQAGKALNAIARETGNSFPYISRKYNWYKKIYLEEVAK